MEPIFGEARNDMMNQLMAIALEGTSSRQWRKEIMYIFLRLIQGDKPNDCSFYQGCGSDICTILIPSIHIHVFSDINGECVNFIRNKLESLSNNGLVSGLDHVDERSSEFHLANQKKTAYFTKEPIERIDFEGAYKARLRVVFEINPGGSTSNEPFFQEVKKQLSHGGLMIGSYVDTPAMFNREAWILANDNGVDFVYFIEDMSDRHLETRLIEYIKQKQIQLAPGPFETTQVSFEGGVYVVSEWPQCFRTSIPKFRFKTVRKVPLQDFGLESIHKHRYISVLRRTNSSSLPSVEPSC